MFTTHNKFSIFLFNLKEKYQAARDMLASSGIRTICLIFLLTTCLVTAASAKHKQDTITVFFPFDVSVVTTEQQLKLNQLAYEEVLDFSKDVLIVGYADYVGKNGYNDTLSMKRATSVRNYMYSLGFKENQVKLVIGKGEVSRNLTGTHGFAPDRKVDIVMLDKTKQPPVATTNAKKPVKTVVQQSRPNVGAPPKVVVVRTDPEPIITPDQMKATQVSEVKKNLDDILTVNINEAIRLENILFPPNSHYITNGSKPELDRLLDIMHDHPAMRVRIEGHICCVKMFPDAWDEDAHDYHLSVNRARFIYEYLIENGIDELRMTYAGFGRMRPVVKNEITEDDTQRNRRVEVRVLAR